MTVREDPSKYVGDNVTQEWQEYRDEQNRKHAEERARTVRDDPGRYTDPNNRNGWYAGGIPVTPGDTNAIKATQKMLGIPQIGIWDKKTNNAYQLWKGKQGGANGSGVGISGKWDKPYFSNPEAAQTMIDVMKKNAQQARASMESSGTIRDAATKGTSVATGYFANSLFMYYNLVKKGGVCDYKEEQQWKAAMPGLRYVGDNVAYLFNGVPIVASDFGNINAGYLAAAMGIPKGILLQQGGAAHLRDHEGSGMIGSQIKSLLIGSENGYGDERDDVRNVIYGYDAYDSDYITKLQKQLRVDETGVWDKKTNNAYQSAKANPKKPIGYMEGFTASADKYTDPNNYNGWYDGKIPARLDAASVKKIQQALGVPTTGLWDKKTNNAYQMRQGKLNAQNNYVERNNFNRKQQLPTSFNSLEDVKKMLPAFAHAILDGFSEKGWEKLTPQQKYDILSPWINGNNSQPSIRAKHWEAEVRNGMKQLMQDPEKWQDLLDKVGLLSNLMGAPMLQGTMTSMQNLLSSPIISSVMSASMKNEMKKAQGDPQAMAALMRDLSAVLNGAVGMKVDKNGVWRSTGTGLQQSAGYYDKAYEPTAKNLLGFDMKSDKVEFETSNGRFVLRGWGGEYGNLLGGEFGLYQGQGHEWNRVDEDRFQIKLTLKDNKGNTLLMMDQGSPKYWQYAAAHPDDIAKLLQQDGYSQKEAQKIANDVNKGNIVVQGTFVGQNPADAPFLNSMAQSVNAKGEQMSTIGDVRYINGVPVLTLELK